MKVKLIAQTKTDYAAIDEICGGTPGKSHHELHGMANDADTLMEFAGRNCYQSFSRPNPKTERADDYLRNIIEQKHESVFEHVHVAFFVDGVSRSLLAELTRHRHLSFSVISQRYVDYTQTEPVIPPALRGTTAESLLKNTYAEAIEDYNELYETLRSQGLKKKQAREAARAVLPNSAPVRMVVSGNLRAWRDVLKRRLHVSADAEIQEFANVVRDLLERYVSEPLAQDLIKYRTEQ